MISINKRKIAVCILLTIITCGLYQIYWDYLLVKNIRAIKKDESSCVGEMLCLIFVPAYSFYWWYTRANTVKYEFTKHSYSFNSNSVLFLILEIFRLGIFSRIIMQSDFNSLPSETKRVQVPSKEVLAIYDKAVSMK
ncbi:MAG: DUF4234 domain-containing protein [Clostridia bacterium]|nr:DUF4234 domain-containing protein [Clostridia bacterium]